MKLTDRTIAVWGVSDPWRFSDVLGEMLAEAVEAAALDVLARFADEYPGTARKLDVYVTIDGERVPEPVTSFTPAPAPEPVEPF